MTLLVELLAKYWKWIALGLLCVSLVGFGWVKRGQHDQPKYDALQAQFEAFKAKVAAEGKVAQEKAAAVQKYQKEVSDETVKGLKQDLADVGARYDSALSELGRVRNESDTRGRALSQLAKSSLTACPGQVDELSGKLDALERGNIQILRNAQIQQTKYIRLWDWAVKSSASSATAR